MCVIVYVIFDSRQLRLCQLLTYLTAKEEHKEVDRLEVQPHTRLALSTTCGGLLSRFKAPWWWPGPPTLC